MPTKLPRTSILVANIGALLHTFIVRDRSDFARLYTSYCQGYLAALTELTTLRAKQPRFSDWLDRFTKSVPGWSLEALLIAPVQRLPRYQLFLEQMLAHTDGERVDFEPVEKALGLVRRVCNGINHSLDENLGPGARSGGSGDGVGSDSGTAAVECANPLHMLGSGARGTDYGQTLGGMTAAEVAQPAPRRRLSQLLPSAVSE